MLKGLSGNALKVIAIIAMTIDHLAWGSNAHVSRYGKHDNQ
jgi:hypothetical protein